MAKGGRYLNTNKAKKNAPEKKKGKGGKSALIVLLVLAVVIGSLVFVGSRFMGSMLGNVNRAEFEEKNQDKSYDDLMAEIYGGEVVDGGYIEEETAPAQDTLPVEAEQTQTTELPEEG